MEFIKKTAILLKLPTTAQATALIYFHKYNAFRKDEKNEKTMSQIDPFVIFFIWIQLIALK